MAEQQKQLSDAMLTEVWTLMHLAVASDLPRSHNDKNKQDSKLLLSWDEHIIPDGDSTAEGDVEMECDSISDGNANESSVDDRQAFKESADKLVVIGDTYNEKSKDEKEENSLIAEIVKCLEQRAVRINKELEDKLCSPVPPPNIFQESLVSLAYSDVKTRLEKFLVGSGGFEKIALVTHITKGVSNSLRDISIPAVYLAAALSYRFITEEYADIILENGGLRNLVASNSK